MSTILNRTSPQRILIIVVGVGAWAGPCTPPRHTRRLGPFEFSELLLRHLPVTCYLDLFHKIVSIDMRAGGKPDKKLDALMCFGSKREGYQAG